MARGVNKVILLGVMGKDPEVRYLQDGKAVTNISIATSESWTDKKSGQKQERTEWHKINFFGPLAEIVGKYTRKGSKIFVEGSLKTRKWTDNAGVERYSTEIHASEMQLLDNKPTGDELPPERRQPAHTLNAMHQSTDEAKAFYTPESDDQQASSIFDDDIPF